MHPLYALCHELPAKMHYYVASCYRTYPHRLIWRGTISRRMATSTAALDKGTPWARGGKDYTGALCWCCCYSACASWEMRDEALCGLPCKRLPELWDLWQDTAASPAVAGGPAGSPISPGHGYIILSYVWHTSLIAKVLLESTVEIKKQRPDIQKTPSVWNPFPLYASMSCSTLTRPPSSHVPTSWIPQPISGIVKPSCSQKMAKENSSSRHGITTFWSLAVPNNQRWSSFQRHGVLYPISIFSFLIGPFGL